MENLIIKETKYTPEVRFNANEEILRAPLKISQYS